MRILGIEHAAPTFTVPVGACDCHVHVFGSAAHYPFWPGRAYTPGSASIEDLLALHDALGIGRVVVVHPSPYGTDNACTVDAVRKMGARARGVVVIDMQTSDAELADMHEAGVRGARVNLESAGQNDPAVAGRLLRETARRVSRLGWHVQTYTVLPVIASLHDAIMDLPTPLVIDHFGRAPAAKGVSQPGFDALLSLVKSGKAYVKLSAPHRISDLTDCADAAAIACALIGANPERMLWGTDWPHPGAKPGAVRKRDEIEPFNPIDDGRALNRLGEWTTGPVQLKQILVENPARLYDF